LHVVDARQNLIFKYNKLDKLAAVCVKERYKKNDSTNKILENLSQEESTIFVKSTALWEYARLFLPSMVGTNLRFKR
jgi:hypothetical protein